MGPENSLILSHSVPTDLVPCQALYLLRLRKVKFEYVLMRVSLGSSRYEFLITIVHILTILTVY